MVVVRISTSMFPSGQQLEPCRGVGGVDQLEVNFQSFSNGLTEVDIKSNHGAIWLAETEQRLRLLDTALEDPTVLD